tara:strand:+ start:536439 stop:537095 length:657 start_codon:yes stop_codon:yes gene_type:complete
VFSNYFKNRAEKKRQRKLQKARCKPWFEVNGDETLRLDYPLNENAVVLDLGGFKGEFAEKIFDKYQSNIHVFEPVKSFFNIIESKFNDNPKVSVYHYGLSDADKEVSISSTGDASSVFIASKDSEKVQLKSILDFITEHNLVEVDLIKINIEGGEYEVLEALLANDRVKMFKNLQIQFHDFIIENARERMENIQQQLSKTHELTYQYDFVWENWKRKD